VKETAVKIDAESVASFAKNVGITLDPTAVEPVARNPEPDSGPWPYATMTDLQVRWLVPDILWGDVMVLDEADQQARWIVSKGPREDEIHWADLNGAVVGGPGEVKAKGRKRPEKVSKPTAAGPGGRRPVPSLYYRLTPEVWAWVWQRAVALEDLVTVKGREDYRVAYEQLCERIGPLMTWVDEQERAGVPGWAGGAWRGIVRPKLPGAPWVPGWVGE
jgi:hypothetical protein